MAHYYEEVHGEKRNNPLQISTFESKELAQILKKDSASMKPQWTS